MIEKFFTLEIRIHFKVNSYELNVMKIAYLVLMES